MHLSPSMSVRRCFTKQIIKHVKFVAPLFFLFEPLQAATLHPIDEMKTLSIPISQEGLTRITVKGDRIFGIYGINGDYTLEADEELGQVFLRPNLTNNMTAISLTVTTEGGLSQDLRLTLKNMPPEAIVLKKQEEPHEASSSKSHSAELPHHLLFITREEVVLLLQSLREGLIPTGYSHVAVDMRRKEGPHLLLKEVRNEKLQGLVFEIENKSPKLLLLKESEFGVHPKTIAVAIKNKYLQPEERTEVYVVRAP